VAQCGAGAATTENIDVVEPLHVMVQLATSSEHT
jgi:hypothetical protein